MQLLTYHPMRKQIRVKRLKSFVCDFREVKHLAPEPSRVNWRLQHLLFSSYIVREIKQRRQTCGFPNQFSHRKFQQRLSSVSFTLFRYLWDSLEDLPLKDMSLQSLRRAFVQKAEVRGTPQKVVFLPGCPGSSADQGRGRSPHVWLTMK